MKIILLIISVFLISGCLYSFEGECVRPIIQVASSNCYKNKGEEFSSMAHYQKLDSIGITNSHQRWKDAVKCGAEYGEYGDYDLKKLHSDNYEKFHSCMETKGYKKFWPAECGYKNSKWDKGICNE